MIRSECLRCSADKIWDHVIRCLKTRFIRKPFVIELAKELKAVKPENVKIEEIFLLIEDICDFSIIMKQTNMKYIKGC